MLSYLILGLLRDGVPRHGYQLAAQYRALTGRTISAGNVYRELSKLVARRLVHATAVDAGADQRRIPYQITELGRERFDEWLLSLAKTSDELESWLLFADRVPTDIRTRVLDRIRDTLWSQGKALERAREDAITAPCAWPRPYAPLPMLLARRLKHVTAELEFLNEFRTELLGPVAARSAPSSVPTARDRQEPGRSLVKRAKRS